MAGCTTARYLAEAGDDVTLLERHGIGAGASGRNGGWLLRRPDSWLNRCRDGAVSIYAELESFGLDCGLREVPLLLVGLDGEELRHAKEYALAVEADPVAPRDEPWLDDDVAGAFVVSGCHSVDPMAATSAMAQAARDAGVQIRLGEEVKRIVSTDGRVEGVESDGGRIDAERVVVAAGPMIGPLLARAGVHLPTSVVRGWLIQVSPTQAPLPYVIEQAVWPNQEEMARISAAPTLAGLAGGEEGASRLVSLLMGARPGGGLVIGTSLNPSIRAGDEATSTVRELAARAIRISPHLTSQRVVDSWSGRRTMLPDGRPVVGAVPGFDGLEVAGGFSSVGMITIPTVCRDLARGELQDELHPGRFGSVTLQ